MVLRLYKLSNSKDDFQKYHPNKIAKINVLSIKIKIYNRLVAGQWKPNSSELLKFSVTSKGCLVAAILLVLDSQG